MVTPLRCRLAALLCVPALWLLPLAAQQPAPVDPPPAPVPAPAPAPAPPPAAETTPPPETAPAPEAGAGERPRGERRRGGRGPGQGQGPERESQDLPEFTPVPAPPLSALAGKQFFWFTMYPNFLAQYDPTTDALVKKVELKHGLFWSTTLTHDRKRMLVVTDQQQTIEVVDLATGMVTAEHSFREDGFILRIRDVRECPGGVHWLVRTDRVKKQIDRYAFEPAQWLLYDTATKKVVRKPRKLPEPLERGAQLSADGTQWLQQDDDGNLRFLNARTCKEEAKIDLRTPRFFGAGAIRLTGTDLLDRRDPNRALMLFTSTDPVEKNRTVWGLCELDLQQKRVVDVQEWGPQQSAWGMRVATRKRVAAAMTGGGGFGGERSGGETPKSRLLLYDLDNGRKLADVQEEFRPRRSLVAISPDGDKIYIGTAGSDFEVFDAQLKRLKTVELDGEIVGRIHVVDG
ncbi:MAG: hypothetical protein MUC36_14705 [Planctomycetes bacterium]|nr:hypothetical protein [Planctomycetota bacterium]